METRKAIASNFDFSDVLVLLGLVSFVAGVSLYSKPAGLIALGLLLLLFGVGSMRKPKAN